MRAQSTTGQTGCCNLISFAGSFARSQQPTTGSHAQALLQMDISALSGSPHTLQHIQDLTREVQGMFDDPTKEEYLTVGVRANDMVTAVADFVIRYLQVSNSGRVDVVVVPVLFSYSLQRVTCRKRWTSWRKRPAVTLR